MSKRTAALALSIVALVFATLSAVGQENGETGVVGTADTGFRIHTVSRSTEAIDYRHKGSTSVDLRGTDLMPKIEGDARVEGRANGVKIRLHLEHLGAPRDFGLAYLTYVVWAITPEGRAHNLGELIVHDGRSALETTSDLQTFALVVTAEPDFAVAEPSELVVAQNTIKSGAAGYEPIEVKYELISREYYRSQVQQVDEPMFGIDREMPLDLLEARNAVRIARDAHADQYASDTYAKAQALLDQSNEQYRRHKGPGHIGTTARLAAQTAEAARVITIKKEEDEFAERQRREQEERATMAQAEAQRQQEQASQAQAQAAQAQAQAEAEAQRRHQEEQARQQAEFAQHQADAQAALANQQAQAAELARQQAEQARQQAEQEKADLRARMLQQLNQVLETRDSARGLIVSMPDVLFDTAKADLKSGARERLAKVSGILIAYPDIHVEIDGYTDSTGTLEFNERLSQERANSVQAFLVTQGVNQSVVTTRAFGPEDPVASNSTAQGRQQNRRVELVVSGSSIGQAQPQ